jgi:transcriptional regulator with XRE-family HTH domain
MSALRSIDLSLETRLKNAEFRREWFRAELETLVPDQFRTLRELRGLTQAQLAELAEMQQSAISRFEASSEANWKLETLLRLADALDARLTIKLERSEDVVRRYTSDAPKGGTRKSVRDVAERSARRSIDGLFDCHWCEDRPARSDNKKLSNVRVIHVR